MRLFEYQAKDLFRSYGIPLPGSVVAGDVAAVLEAFATLQPPLALKSQVLSGGRGKA